jgi:type I restriction enzyme S subunit
VLSTIQYNIEAQDKIIDAAKQLKKSLMKHLFAYGPVPISEAENVQLKETEIGPVPEHWKVVRLIDVAESKSDIVGGPFGSNLKVSDYKDSGVPIIRLQNIERNRFINKDIKFISEAKAKQLEYHSYYPGDIVLAKLGDPIGKTCMVPNDLRAGIVIADVVRIRTNSCFTNKRFIVYALNTELCTTQFRSQKTGTTRPRVNVSNVRNIKIPLPPLKEQQEIASILSTIDKKIEAEENRKNALQSLFKTMLHHLMTGKVRVKDLEETAS